MKTTTYKKGDEVELELYLLLDEGGPFVCMNDMSRRYPEYALLGGPFKHKFVVGLTEEEIVAARVDALRMKQKEVKGKAQAECDLLEKQVQQLLALAYEPGETS